MRELNIGYSDFKNIILNDNYYIDKSLLIKEIIKSQKAVLLFPRPRRFGKTLNLSMLKYYFDISQPENKNLFKNLKIWQSDDNIKQHCVKYPVIYTSFKDAKANTWEECKEIIASEISKMYKEHRYLLNDNILFEDEKNDFNKILNRTAKTIDYQNSIENLSEYLHRYHKQKVVILIDEYDTPIQAGYDKYYDDVVMFMRNLLSGAFKDNTYLYKGVITGILRVSKESIFSGLNNLSVYSVLQEEFADKFGFTEYEIKEILKDFNVKTPYSQIKKWYNGYKFGKIDNIYNPWSILNFVVSKSQEFYTYWANTSSDVLIKKQLKDKNANEIREDLLKLINNETIKKDIEENFVFPDLEADKELLWTLLTYSGYLTTVHKFSRKTYELIIPNLEIITIFKDTIIDWIKTDIKVKKILLENTANYLINNNIEKFESGFKQIIGDTFSYYDNAKNHEYVYHSYILGLLAIIGDDYIIKSNRESGEGRYDIMLIPIVKTRHGVSQHGVVIEIKQLNVKTGHSISQQEINKEIKAALTQIDKNNYYKELIDNKVEEEKIIKLPIIFVGKEPYITPI